LRQDVRHAVGCQRSHARTFPIIQRNASRFVQARATITTAGATRVGRVRTATPIARQPVRDINGNVIEKQIALKAVSPFESVQRADFAKPI